MFEGDIYLTPEDLMKLMGSYSRTYARRKLHAFKKEVGKVGRGFTIGDYCQVTGDNYREIFSFLRGRDPEWNPENSKNEKDNLTRSA